MRDEVIIDDDYRKSVVEETFERGVSDLSHSEGIWWLASFPKSGNTWMRAFLDAYIIGTVDINALLTSRADVTPNVLQSVSPVPVNLLTPHQAITIRPAAIFAGCVLHGGAPDILKTHAAYDVSGYNAPYLLTSGAVYIVRDPRDVAVSYSKHNGLTIDKAITQMNNDQLVMGHPATGNFYVQGAWHTSVTSWMNTAPFPVHTVRYEDMLDREKEFEVFRGVVDFLRLDYNSDRLRSAIEMCRLDTLKDQEKRLSFKERKNQEKFFGTGSGWRNALTDAQVAQIEKDHGEVMVQLGYDLVSEAREVA